MKVPTPSVHKTHKTFVHKTFGFSLRRILNIHNAKWAEINSVLLGKRAKLLFLSNKNGEDQACLECLHRSCQSNIATGPDHRDLHRLQIRATLNELVEYLGAAA